jgi:ADP-heptose:LPS heptosyltransferase
MDSNAPHAGTGPAGRRILFPRGMRRRWWLFRPIDAVVALWPRRRAAGGSGGGPGGGMVIVRMDGLGDMALFRPVLDHYARAFGIARDQITVLGCESWHGLADTVFAGYRVAAIDEHRFERRFFYRLRIALWLKRQGFRIAVCDTYFRKTLTSDSLVHMSGAQERIVSLPYISDKTEAEFDWFLARAGRVIDTGPHPTHELERHYNFLAAVAGRPVEPSVPTLPWRDAPSAVPEGAPYVVINFGSNEPGRNWPFGNYLALARRAIARGYRVAFVGAAREVSESARIAGELEPGSVVDLIGRTGLDGLMDVIAHAHAMLTNETGPGHFGILLGVPTVMVFGGGHHETFVPYPEHLRPANARFVNRHRECYGCLWICPYRESAKDPFPCIEAVEIEDVWQAVEGFVPAL